MIFKKYNYLIKKIVKRKAEILNLLAVAYNKQKAKIPYYEGQIDLIKELLDGKG